MIVRDRPQAWQLFFVLRGSLLPRIWPQIAGVGLLSLLIVAGHKLAPHWVPSLSAAPFALLGIAISVFLSFRNSASHDRWWEARKLWGEIIQSARDIARQTAHLDEGAGQGGLAPAASRPGGAGQGVAAGDGTAADRTGQAANAAGQGEAAQDADARVASAHPLTAQDIAAPAAVRSPDRRAILTSVIAFAADTARQLRAGPASAAPPRNAANAHLTDAALVVARLARANRLTLAEEAALTASITRLSHALVGCERLVNTPLPFAYTLLLHRTAYLFCFMMPFGFADNLGWATPLATMLVAYTFFGLDALGDELEEPFGLAPNDLPIAAYATMVEITLRDAMGDPDLPPMPQPVGYLLF